MAKDKKKKGKSPKKVSAKAKAKATKLPKRIAGVTLSDTLRTEGGFLIDLLRNPVVATLAAGGIAALTKALSESGQRPRTPANDATPEPSPRPAIDLAKGAAMIGSIIAARAGGSDKKS